MRVERYNESYKDLWNKFIENSKNGLFMFNRNYMDYHADRFRDHSLIVYDEGNIISALLPANEKETVFYSHQGLTFGGFITDNSMKVTKMVQTFDSLKQYLLEHGFEHLVYKAIPHIYHQQPAQEDLYALFLSGAILYRVDVSTTINLSNKIAFSELRKRGAKKALRNGVFVHQSSDFNSFIEMLSLVLEERYGIKPVHSVYEIELLASRFPNNIKLYLGKRDREVLAGVLIYEYPNMVHAQYIASTPAGKNVGALDAVFFHLINEIYPEKQYFDFGISTEDEGTYLNTGLINQKEGFGGRAVVHQFYKLKLV